LDDLNCRGNEGDVAYCGHRGWGKNNCEHSEDASVICVGEVAPFVYIFMTPWLACNVNASIKSNRIYFSVMYS